MRCSILGPNAFSTRRGMSLVRAAFSLSKAESACRPTWSALAACVTVNPSGSITSRRIRPPTCGGFFIGMVQAPPLMVVNQVNIKGVAFLKSKDHAQVTGDRDAPEAFQVTFERVQLPPRK